MRCLMLAVLVVGCDQGAQPPSPSPPPPSPLPLSTYGVDSFIEISEVTVTDIAAPPNPRRIRITGDGALIDQSDLGLRHRQVPARRFGELVNELTKAGALSSRGCGYFDHGRHTTLTISVPEGRNKIRDATTCDSLREPIRQIIGFSDSE
jgi:hypothetical protein